MRVLILGAGGMLGHKLFQRLQPEHEVWGTVRGSNASYARYDIFDLDRLLSGVDVFRFDSVVNAVSRVHPDWIVNCIGIVKQLREARDPLMSITVNSLFPHQVASLCQACNARMIHISTDCVFEGSTGMYTEDDIPVPTDLYGHSKLMGEVTDSGCLTIRTAIIGRELRTDHGLVEWFLSQAGGRIQGYTRAVFSGLTTAALATTINSLMSLPHSPEGLFHISTAPISKYDLLCSLQEAFSIPVDIAPFAAVQINRSLDSTRFQTVTGLTPPTWNDMISEMACDQTPYGRWH